jgi:hypothetical protein
MNKLDIVITEKKDNPLMKSKYKRLFTSLRFVMLLMIITMWQCKKDEPQDTTKPTVTSTVSLNDAVNVAMNSVSTATFSESMDPLTITSATFTLMQGSTPVTGVVAYTGLIATFTPASNLEGSKLYTATISNKAKDVAGNAMAMNYSWSFTTAAAPDVVKPTAVSAFPLSSATNVAFNSKPAVTFSEAMDPLTINSAAFTLMQGTTIVPGTVTYTGLVATFTPSANFSASTVYTATITTGAKDVAGNALASNYVWSFTTGVAPDVTAPVAVSTIPLDASIGADLNAKISATFSEALDPLTINITTFTLKQGTTAVTGTVTFTGLVATFTPTVNLAAGTVYTATITTGTKDVAGNALASNKVWSFTTAVAPDVTAPVAVSTIPVDASIGADLNAKISATFSEALDPLTINTTTFTLNQGTTAVTGTVTYSGLVATFTPTVNLTAGTVYTATISTGTKDLAGNALASNKVWSFTTGTTLQSLAPVNLGSAANYVILAKTAISNISTSNITGDLGLSPAATSYITGLSLTDATGYATSAQVTGSIYAADMAAPTAINLTTAVENMITAYNDAAGRPSPDYSELGTGNIGGKTLTPGLYKWTNTVTLPSDVTISGGANDVWIFQIAQDLTMSNGVNITLTGGAQAKNIFWQVAGTVTIGTTAHFEGIVLSMTGITFQTGASFKGRALAQTAVVLDGNTVIVP